MGPDLRRAEPWRDAFGAVEFETAGGKWEARYYQHKAINAALEAIARGERRILLTLATGTGKTSIAFQIAWKLFHAKWSLAGEPERRPRILFLADRNILADQAYNAFSAFEATAVARIDPPIPAQAEGGRAPKNASVFFTIYQTFMTGEGEPVFTGYPPDFFDFIVIDECHRGGAQDESTWRKILEHFEPAVQLGLTATPKRRHNADTYAYFGEPVYTYALRDGIEDGYLTPFKVRQMASTIDEYVYVPEDDVIQGEVEAGQRFTEEDFNTKIIIEERELSRVQEFMGQTDQSQKTLVFCATQDHAALVRDLINQVKDSTDPNYCHRVTANDGDVGEQHLRDLPGQREDGSHRPHHVAEALHRGGRAQHPAHRPDAPDPLDDRVQADHRAGNADLRGEGLLHDLGLREGARELQRSGVGRRARGAGAARAKTRRRSHITLPDDNGGGGEAAQSTTRPKPSRSGLRTARRAPSATSPPRRTGARTASP